ncbi:unnamed protein product [Pylaiella littoralis]
MFSKFSRFYGKGKVKYENEKRAYMFLSMFAKVSNELGLLNSNITSDMIHRLIFAMDGPDNSSDVFIQLVMDIHSQNFRKGQYIMRLLGVGILEGFSAKDLLEDLSYDELKYLFDLMLNVLGDLKKLFKDMDQNVLKEPLMLLIAFSSHVKYLLKRAPRYTRNDRMKSSLKIKHRGPTETEWTRVTKDSEDWVY